MSFFLEILRRIFSREEDGGIEERRNSRFAVPSASSSRPEQPRSQERERRNPTTISSVPEEPAAYSRPQPLQSTQIRFVSPTPAPPFPPNTSSSSYPPRRPFAPSGSDPWNKPSASSPNLETGITLPVYSIPEDVNDLIKKDLVPKILKKPLSPSTYADFFAALLYSEDHYIEKWSNFLLSGVTLELYEETVSKKARNASKTVYMDMRSKFESDTEEKKVYVKFEIDSIPERRPYLLSRDFVNLRHSGKKDVEPFQGILSRVEKSTHVLTEFGEDFHSQYSTTQRYDVSFSFNRVCLKRCHQAVQAAVDPSLNCIIFPQRVSRTRRPTPTFLIPFNPTFNKEETSAVNQILSLKAPPPYLIVQGSSTLRIQEVIKEAILQIYTTVLGSRILITAAQNKTCDSLMSSLKKEIPDTEMFRANAAFREVEDVPDEILSSSSYKGECFSCPAAEVLRKFKVITSTFMSSFRLRNHGINAGHFSHIFAVDACSVPEPEIMVTLANLADESTAVVITGSYGRFPGRVRSDIGRANGLRRSYFKRLLESEPYLSRDPEFVNYL